MIYQLIPHSSMTKKQYSGVMGNLFFQIEIITDNLNRVYSVVLLAVVGRPIYKTVKLLDLNQGHCQPVHQIEDRIHLFLYMKELFILRTANLYLIFTFIF